MPKKSPLSPSRQESLFPKRPIPQMPEGYYSSGPNPNLRRFVEEHARPYYPATNKYKVKPFDKPITTTEATAIYNMHTYWSKKPPEALGDFARYYTLSILWPYAREYTADQLRRAGLSFDSLPVINPQVVTKKLIEGDLIEIKLLSGQEASPGSPQSN